MDLSRVKACVVDQGFNLPFARVLGRTFGKVYYYMPWEARFPKLNQSRVGTGFPEIERIYSPFGVMDEVTLWVFPDVYFGPMQEWLRKHGAAVWGSGALEGLEIDRLGVKQLQERLGLAVGPYEVVTGTAALRKYLKAHKDVWVKVDGRARGHVESFHSDDYATSEPVVDELDNQLGPFKTDLAFIVEDSLPDMVEVGIDGYCVDGQFPDPMLYGIEVKDMGYVGEIVPFASIPEPLRRFEAAIEPVLRHGKYRGCYSSETRVGKDSVPYMIDCCARCGTPPNELYQELYTNLAEIVAEGAAGRMVNPIPLARYGVEIMLHAEFFTKNAAPIEIPDKLAQNVKVWNAVQVGGRLWHVPQVVETNEIGAVIGWGDSLDAAIKMATEAAGEVKAYSLNPATGSVDKAKEQIAEAQKIGLRIFQDVKGEVE